MNSCAFDLGFAVYAQLEQPEDFCFLVGGHPYKCNKVLAVMLSPIVAQMLSCDIMADTLKLDIDDSDFKFKQIWELMKGQTLLVTPENRDYLFRVGSLLGNSEIIDITKATPSASLITTVIETALEKISIHQSAAAEIDYIAEHLYECTFAILDEFSVSDLCSIFFSPRVRVEDESTFFSLVLDIVKDRDEDARVLLHSVHFENLSVADMMRYTEEMRLSDLTGAVFHSLCKRITERPMRRISDEQEFKYHKGHAFEGLFWNLQKQWNKSLFASNILKIEASDGSDPSRIITGEGADCWYSRNEENSWVMIDFLDHAFKMSQYSLRTFVGAPNSGHLKTWAIEGSNNGKDWTVIDKRKDNENLNGRNKYRTLRCHGAKQFFRYIRLRQTGKNHCGNDFLFLSSIEFFGCLV